MPDFQETVAIVGVWRLVSVTLAGSDGPKFRDDGSALDGMIIYTQGGHMSAHIVLPARDGTDTPSHHAYFGSYSIDSADGTITHHRLANNNPGLPQDVSRGYRFLDNDQLELTPHGGRGDQLNFARADN